MYAGDSVHHKEVSGQFSVRKVEDALAFTRKKGEEVHWAEGTVWTKSIWDISRVAMAFSL